MGAGESHEHSHHEGCNGFGDEDVLYHGGHSHDDGGAPGHGHGDHGPAKELKRQAKADRLPQQRRLKMKVARIMLDNNAHTVLGLKHIYTLLLVNRKIDIRIDMPTVPRDDDDSQAEDIELEDSVPDGDPLLNDSKDQADGLLSGADKESDVSEEVYIHEKDEDEEFEPEQAPDEGPPGICMLSCFRPCRKYYYPKPGQARPSCFRACCRGFMVARQRAYQFRISVSSMTSAEVGTQATLRYLQITGMALYALITIALPFFMAPAEDGGVGLSLVVYAAFVLYLLY